MKHAAIFKTNRSQAVRIPKEFAFPEGLDRVVIRREGSSIVLSPVDSLWDEFFAAPGLDIQEPEDLPPQDRESL